MGCIYYYFGPSNSLFYYTVQRSEGLVVSTLPHISSLFVQFLDDESDIPKSLPVFKWLPIQNITYLDICRNSRQGDSLIVDELGACTWLAP